jgi:hypothetical protein
MTKTKIQNTIQNITEITIDKKKYIIMSVYTGNNGKTLQETLLNLAELKAMQIMGLA